MVKKSLNRSKCMWDAINSFFHLKKKKKQKSIKKLFINDTEETDDPQKIAHALNSYFVNIGPQLANCVGASSYNYDHYLKGRPLRSSFFLGPTDEWEIETVVSRFKNKKSKGPDRIPMQILKNSSSALSPILAPLINEMFTSGYFPSSLKIAKVVPLFKAGKDNFRNNYRPISLLSPLSKLIEKLVYKRLLKFLNKNHILNDYQYGFRNKHSTSHAILDINENLLSNKDNGYYTAPIFLDLSKAFDCVNHNILLKKMHFYGIRGIALDFFKSYLSDRKQFVEVGGLISSVLQVICGVPQGSTLGPLLFLLYINDLPNTSNFKIILFADDTCLHLSDKNPIVLEQICNLYLGFVDDWFKANMLTTNLKKASKFMLTCPNSNMHINHFILKMGTVTLERVYEMEYLGVIVDCKINWRSQINLLISKLSRSAGVLSKLRYYFDTPVLLSVYYAIVYSHLQYAILCWASANQSDLTRINTIHNRILRYVSKSPRRSNITDIYLNMRVLKINDIFELELAKFMFRFHKDTLPRPLALSFRKVSEVHNIRTRSASRGMLYPFASRKREGTRTIKHRGVICWNNIPASLRLKSFPHFKQLYKENILSSY